jgi:hypothetical protein
VRGTGFFAQKFTLAGFFAPDLVAHAGLFQTVVPVFFFALANSDSCVKILAQRALLEHSAG